MAAKEFDITDYDYETEKNQIESEDPSELAVAANPLTAPPQAGQTNGQEPEYNRADTSGQSMDDERGDRGY